MRWIDKELDEGVALILEGKVFINISPSILRFKKRGIDIKGWGMVGSLAGGVGTLSYEHLNISEPAILYVLPFFPLFPHLFLPLFYLLLLEYLVLYTKLKKKQ